MSKELAKTYDPHGMEDRIYQKWLDKKYFHAEVDHSKTPFTIVIPPPNITGQLHMGHALDNTMQDILIRFKRMQGYNALWQPGTDHASIATEVKIIEKLKEGYDLIQGSRFIKGGKAINTPFIRTVSVKLIHAPIISLTAHQRFTDTTNAYRAYSRRYLTDERVQPLRDVFMTYELLAYLSVRATQIGYKACEIPVKRAYPKTGKTPTKISFFKGNSELMSILLKNARGAYNPKQR